MADREETTYADKDFGRTLDLPWLLPSSKHDLASPGLQDGCHVSTFVYRLVGL